VSGNQKLHPLRKTRFTKSLGKTEAYGVRAQLISGFDRRAVRAAARTGKHLPFIAVQNSAGSIGDSGDLDAAVLGFILAV
jgi:hypothetical protein